MHRPDLTGARAFTAALAAALGLGLAGAAHGADKPAQPQRFEAPIRVEQPATFIALPLPPAVYEKSAQPGLADLRVADARGERVPFTLLAPRSAFETAEPERPATLYPLPPRPAAGASWPSPVDIVVDGDRITVRRLGAGATAAMPGAAAAVPGWLIDTGERRRDAAPVRRLRLEWSGSDDFTAAYRLEASDDLRRWTYAGGGQLIALRSTSGPLTQPLVELANGSGRFVRLLWVDPASAPRLRGASGVAPERRAVELDAATVLELTGTTDPQQARALVFDLGAPLPVEDVLLRFAAGTHVAPVAVQGRRRESEPWRDLGGAVFNRFESAGAVASEAPAFPVAPARVGPLRYLRLVVDERAAPVRPGEATLAVRARLDTLVFAASGTAPYRLLAGSADAPTGALPPATLVPGLDDERARFGRASLGDFGEIEAAARAAESEAQAKRLRPIVLWSVLLAGVLLLGGMVWRLARSERPAGDT